jgi:hypothetical protein
MIDWWIFILADYTDRVQLALTLIAFGLLFLAGITTTSVKNFSEESDGYKKAVKYTITAGLCLLFFAQVMLPTKKAIFEAYIAYYNQQGYSLIELQQHIETIQVYSKSLIKDK